MKLAKLLFFFFALTLLSLSMLYAKPEYTKKEGKACTYCHSKGKELNDTGKCYQKQHKLDGCKSTQTK